MPFLAAGALLGGAVGAGALGAGAAAAVGGIAGGAMLGASLGSAAQGHADSKKAASQAAAAAQNGRVDINALNDQVTQQSIANAQASRSLQNQLSPGVTQLQDSSIASLLKQLNLGNPYSSTAANYLTKALNAPVDNVGFSPLSQAAQARALSELNLGGQLPLDVANQIIRSSAARAGAVGGTGSALGMGRDISARDLGLTSLDLLNSRLNTAANLGATADQFNLNRGYFGLNALANKANLATSLSNLGQQDLNRALSIAQLAQSIPSPTVGLDPSSVANVAVGNSNLAANAAQNAAAIRAGQSNALIGLGGNVLGAFLPSIASNFGNSGMFSNPGVTTNSGGYILKSGFGPG